MKLKLLMLAAAGGVLSAMATPSMAQTLLRQSESMQRPPQAQQWRATESSYQNPTATVDFFGYQVPAQGPATELLD